MRTGVAAAGLTVLFAVLIGWIEIAPSGQAADTTLDILSMLVPAAAAVLAGLAARANRGRVRAGWGLLTAGLACAALAEAIWAHRDLFGATLAFPNPADAAYLTFLAAVTAAMLTFPAGDNRFQSKGRLVLDGLIMAASLFVVSWVTVIRPAAAGGSAGGLGLVVAMAYPILNVIALTVTSVLAARSGSGQRTPLSLLVCGLFAMTLAESVFAYLSVDSVFKGHHTVELVWLAGMVLILLATVAGRHARFDARPAEPPGWASVWLPYAPFMLAVVVLVPQPRTVVLDLPVLLSAALLLPAVLVRQFLAVAENQRLVATVAEQALHDPLTGLPNRSLFAERLEQVLAAAARDGSPVGILLIDLDDFKLVNDTLGHACGDELLVAAATRLTTSAGPQATVARLGGDEFAAVVIGATDAIRRTADRVAGGFDEPFRVEGHDVRVRPTVGLAITENGQATATELLKEADTAMYAGKRADIGGVHLFTPETPRAVRSGGGSHTLRMLSELRSTVEHGGLALVYRPQADLRTGRVVGVEALLRWPHPELGLLLPQQFLPLIRQNGLIDPVTDFVVRRALGDAAAWHGAGLSIGVAVNLFAPCLQDRGLPQRIEGMLAASGVAPQALTLEITEDLPISRDGHPPDVLAALREQGIRIAVDDFGSGYSTLADVCRLPVDEIKLDGTFVGSVLTDAKVAAVVRSVTALAGELGLTTVAEGVRDAETAQVLLRYGCDTAQGDHIGEAMTAGDVPAFLGVGGPAASGPADRVAR